MKIGAINSLSEADFVALLEGIYEHSAWVAEKVQRRRPFESRDALRTAMREEVERASEDEKLALLRAHPDLGTRLKISLVSLSEQAGAGLDNLAPDEYDLARELNNRYREKFGFPFIYAVRGSGKADIFRALTHRVDEPDREGEFHRALWEVHRIAGFRLQDLIEEGQEHA